MEKLYDWRPLNLDFCKTPDSCLGPSSYLVCFASLKSLSLLNIDIDRHLLDGKRFRIHSTLLRLQHLWKCESLLHIVGHLFFVRQDIGWKTLDIFGNFPWQKWWVRRPSGGGPSVSGGLVRNNAKEASGSTWVRPRGRRIHGERWCSKGPGVLGK